VKLQIWKCVQILKPPWYRRVQQPIFKGYKKQTSTVNNCKASRPAKNELSEVCGIIKPGRRDKLNRSQAVNVHKLLNIRYLLPPKLQLVLIYNVEYEQSTRIKSIQITQFYCVIFLNPCPSLSPHFYFFHKSIASSN